MIRSDLLLESLLLLLKRNPLYVFAAVLWLFRRGKSGLKEQIAAPGDHSIRPALPYNTELIAWIQTERDSGRKYGSVPPPTSGSQPKSRSI